MSTTLPFDMAGRLWDVAEAAGDTFGPDLDFKGTALTIEIKTPEEARAVLSVMLAGEAPPSSAASEPQEAPGASDDAGWRWYSGSDGEHYSGTHDTREEAIAELDGYGGYIVEARQDPLRLSDYVDAEAILECAEEDSDDMKGEDGEPIFVVKPDQQADLEARIKAVCDEWQTAHGLIFTPYMFTASRNEERIEETPRALREFVTDEVSE